MIGGGAASTFPAAAARGDWPSAGFAPSSKLAEERVEITYKRDPPVYRSMRLLIDGSNLSLRFTAPPVASLYSPDGALARTSCHTTRAKAQRPTCRTSANYAIRNHPPQTRARSLAGETDVGELIDRLLEHPTIDDCNVVFDGAAFHGEHMGCAWTGGDDSISITFTERMVSADDTIVQLCGLCEQAAPPEQLTSKQAVALCEREPDDGDAGVGAVTATLVKSPSGRSQRKRVEAHLSGVGLRNVGQTMSMPLLTPMQRARSLAVARGLARLGGDPIKFVHLPAPGAVVVTDDRGLARRCLTTAQPAMVLTSSQFASMLGNLLPVEEEEDEEGDEEE